MSSILRNFKLREHRESTDKATFTIKNGETILKELIRASDGELLTGLRAFDLARLDEDDGYVVLLDHMKKYLEEDRLNEMIDPLIMEDRSCAGKEQQLQAFEHLIFECVNESPVDRPTMVDVAKTQANLSLWCLIFLIFLVFPCSEECT